MQVGAFISNEYSANEGDNWVQITPFGKFPHPNGLQVVTADDSNMMVREFKSLANAANRTFFGTPFYVGHPDVPELQNKYTDHEPKGRIKDMETRHDAACKACNAFMNETSDDPCGKHGLFGKVKWNAEGKRLIQNEAFEGHSPYWKLIEKDDGYHPVWLKSVGFTNEPNIPVKTITSANVKGNNMPKHTTLIGYVNELLGTSYPDNEQGYTDAFNSLKTMKDTCNSHEALQGSFTALKSKHDDLSNAVADLHKRFGANEIIGPALKALTDAGITLPAEGVVVFVANELATTRSARTKADADLTAANARVTTLTTELANERKARSENLLALLLTGGFITKAEQDQLRTKFSTAATFDAAVNEALASKPKINVVSQVGHLGRVDTTIKSNVQLQQELTQLTHDAMNEKGKNGRGLSYNEAWAKVKASERGKQILQLMEAGKAARANGQ